MVETYGCNSVNEYFASQDYKDSLAFIRSDYLTRKLLKDPLNATNRNVQTPLCACNILMHANLSQSNETKTVHGDSNNE